ncbi:MAG: hypothetical protein P8P74_07660 [Crocinitomicaceae bacterium]|nr:hypothetical protein [Crocinitomicaceae bacterium]
MKKSKVILLVFLALLVTSSCKKETIENRDKLILGKWDCIDYSDTLSNVLKGKPPVFISHLYESGYSIKRNNFMWVRDLDENKDMFTNKDVDCEWLLSDDHLQLSLIFPDNNIEKYEIIELTRKKMILKGKEGFWAQTESTYVFEKK